MTVGGYVVRGLRLACNKRAKAIRFPNGAFERVNPSSCNFILGPSQQPPLPIMNAADDFAAAASSICLAIHDNTPRPASNLMPQLEQQAAIEASDLLVQERIQLHKNKIMQQFEQDTITQTMASVHVGKRPPPPITTITTTIPHKLLSWINDHNHNQPPTLKGATGLYKSYWTRYRSYIGNYNRNRIILQAPMQVQISFLNNSHTKPDIVDELHGLNDPYRPGLGHEDLAGKITTWATDVIENGIWTKSQVLVGVLTDVIGVVQAEVQLLIKQRHNNIVNCNGHNGVLDVARRHAIADQHDLAMQASPISVSSDGSGANSINARIIAQLGLGNKGNGGGGGIEGDGGGDEPDDVGNDNSWYNSNAK